MKNWQRNLPYWGVLLAIGCLLTVLVPVGNSLWFEVLSISGSVKAGKWDGGCTYTQGYWKNHPRDWPVDEITIGSMPYSKKATLAILKTPPKGDATLILARQLIPAKLNVLNGADSSAVDDYISAADAWLNWYPIGSKPPPPDRDELVSLARMLDDYNSGDIGPGHCDDDDEDDDGDDDGKKDGDDESLTVPATPSPTPSPTPTPLPPTAPPPPAVEPTPNREPTPVPLTKPTPPPPTPVPTGDPNQEPTPVPLD